MRGIAQDGGTRGGTFHGEMDRCRESQGWTTACSVVCLNVTGRAEERIDQSKRARAGSLAIVDEPQFALTCILRAGVVVFLSRVAHVLFFVRFRIFCFKK